MDMKTLKMYESPKMEVVKLKPHGALLIGSNGGGEEESGEGGDI